MALGGGGLIKDAIADMYPHKIELSDGAFRCIQPEKYKYLKIYSWSKVIEFGPDFPHLGQWGSKSSAGQRTGFLSSATILCGSKYILFRAGKLDF